MIVCQNRFFKCSWESPYCWALLLHCFLILTCKHVWSGWQLVWMLWCLYFSRQQSGVSREKAGGHDQTRGAVYGSVTTERWASLWGKTHRTSLHKDWLPVACCLSPNSFLLRKPSFSLCINAFSSLFLYSAPAALILWRLFTTYVQRSLQSRRQRINLCLSSGLLALHVAPEGIAWSFQSSLVIIYRLAVHLLHHVAITAVSKWQLTRPVPAHSSGAGKQRPRPICTGPAPANAPTSTFKTYKIEGNWSILGAQASLTEMWSFC